MIEIGSRKEREISGLALVKNSMSGSSKISSYTHNLYKYPACFPELFPRAVLNSFSKEGDWILDPFSGGGTSAVESMVGYRNFMGTDINDLAIFSAVLKTTLLDKSDLKELDQWVHELRLGRRYYWATDDQKFFQNVIEEHEDFVRRMKSCVLELSRPRARLIATGALLRLMQYEVERTETIISTRSLQSKYKEILELFIRANMSLGFSMERSKPIERPKIDLITADVSEPEFEMNFAHLKRQFDLIVTSPPYPKRHILYNKWQVRGRAETRMPYWIIDSDQHLSESIYTMGGREHKASLEIYLTTIFGSFLNLNPLLKKGGLVFQVVAFSDVKYQLFGFLDSMASAGFQEVRNVDSSNFDGRMWRTVPNQKWFNRVRGNQGVCKEVILVHQKVRNT